MKRFIHLKTIVFYSGKNIRTLLNVQLVAHLVRRRTPKNEPSKVLWYFPIIHRFRRMFSSPQILHDLTWHEQSRVNNGKLTDPHDIPSWKLVDNTWKGFWQEKSNLRLAFSVDGIIPHKSLSSEDSCFSVILITYNLPPYLCLSSKFMMLDLLILGPNYPIW